MEISSTQRSASRSRPGSTPPPRRGIEANLVSEPQRQPVRIGDGLRGELELVGARPVVQPSLMVSFLRDRTACELPVHRRSRNHQLHYSVPAGVRARSQAKHGRARMSACAA